MTTETQKPRVVGRCCKFASTHTVNREVANGRFRYDKDDLLVVKETVFLEDGSHFPHLKLIENFKRPFWLTKPAFRTHKSKKEWESLDKVERYESTQTMLADTVSQALGKGAAQAGIRRVNRNPYVYGTDTTAAAWLRMNYAQKWPEQHGFPFDVVVYDIETDVLDNHGLYPGDWAVGNEPIIGITATLIRTNGKVESVTVTLKDFIEKKGLDVEKKFFDIVKRDMPYILEEKKNDETPEDLFRINADIKFEVYKTERELLQRIFDQLHIWKPDIVCTWNVAFDVKHTIKRIQAHNLDPADFFCDPIVPKKYRKCIFKEDAGVQVSRSDKKKTKLFYQCWHMLEAPASFRWVDACSVYWYIRKASGNLKSAALDYVLKQEIKMGKYEIEEAEKYRGLEKHIFMQRNYPVEYMVYNLFDCIGIAVMELKNHDISISLSGATGITELDKLPSNPTKLMNNFMAFLYFKRNKVLGTTSDDMIDDLDKYIVSQKGWISTLPTNSLEYTGVKCIEEFPDLNTKIYVHCADLDVKSSYPTTGIFANISRETTQLELSSIEGVNEAGRYLVGLNMMAGNVNAVTFCEIVNQAPNLEQLRALYRGEIPPPSY